jgi:hopene-associated glycosyltransferase HpnB
MIAGILFGFVPLAIWLYLALGRDFFWLLRERDDNAAPIPARWPSIVAVVPARDEADVISRSVGSLLAQDYPGDFHIILVDDQSSDGTGDIARALAHNHLTVLTGAPRPPGWTGKLWAMQQGIDRASAYHAPDYLWFTDADIAHSSDNLRQLAARAQSDDAVLVSLMAKLHSRSSAEHFLIPAFVYFFAMLYPFAAVNNAARRIAAAAGGCMLARREALEAAGGIAAIRGSIIDDCALARVMKKEGPIWLGLTNRATSLRPYEHIADIRHMVSRSAYAQLGYSPLLLVGTLLGLALVFFAAPAAAMFGWGISQGAAWGAWLLMAISFQPMLRFYRLSPLWGLALPIIAGFYAGFTLDSAIHHWRGRGGMWKGRVQAGGAP